MELIALLSQEQGIWGQVSGLLTHGEWDKVIIIGDASAKQFAHQRNFEFVQCDLSKKLRDLKDEFMQKLKGRLDGLEVALSIASGDGKEHMALISAILSIPVGVRFTALTKDGVVFL